MIFFGLVLIGLVVVFSYGMDNVSAVSPIYVSTHGNNSWNGLHSTHIQGTLYGPKATIKNATGTIKSGGALHIASGIYKENNITINKNMYIIGAKQSNTIINGNNKGPIFHITHNVVKVSIHNLTIINAKTTNYAAIENGGFCNLYIDRCSFTNNTGRAIFNGGEGGNVIVKDTIFSKNTAAIYNYVDNTMRLTNCTFTNNNGNKGDYVISNGGVLYIDRCKFNNNPTVTISNYFGASIIVSRSIFTNNTCAIESDGGLKVTGCIFTKNTKGAIWNDRVATVTSSKFVGNNAVNGGAIRNDGEVALTVTNSTFTNNTATENGGAIHSIYDSKLKVSNCTFINNIAKENGGAIYSGSEVIDLNVTSCNFNNNTANDVGGAIYTYSGTVNFNRLIGDKNYELYNNGTNSLDAKYNWWGSNNPDFSNLVSGVVNTNPWIVLTINANPTTINNGGNSAIIAGLLRDSNGAYHSPLLTHLPDGIPVSFSSDGKGSVNPTAPVNGMVAGKATTTFTAGIPGISSIAATVDSQTVTSQVNILPVALVTSSDPINNASNVAINKIIKIYFNQPIKFSNNIWIELHRTATGPAKSFKISISDNVLSLTTSYPLAIGTKYTVIIHSKSITDMMGNALAAPYTTRFTTSLPPVVTSTSPLNNAFNVAVNKVIQINFSKAIQLGANPWIELKNQYGQAKPFKTSINGSTLNITTDATFARGTTYTVILHSNSVTSTGGAGLAAPYTTRFTTTTA